MGILSSIMETLSGHKKSEKKGTEEIKKEITEAIYAASEDGHISKEEIVKIEELREEFGISETDLGDIKLDILKKYIQQAVADNLVTQHELDFIVALEDDLALSNEDKEVLQKDINGLRQLHERAKNNAHTLDLDEVKQYLRQAKIEMRNQNFEDAIVELNQILEVQENAVAFYKRGNCFFKLDKKEEACNDWKKANTLGYELAKEKIEEHCTNA